MRSGQRYLGIGEIFKATTMEVLFNITYRDGPHSFDRNDIRPDDLTTPDLKYSTDSITIIFYSALEAKKAL